MLHSIQVLRGLAAWAVVFHHIVQSYYFGKTDSLFFQFFAEAGTLGVDVFFVLSGFVMAHVAGKYQQQGGKFWINRVFRIVPIYWFYTLLLVLSVLAFPTGTYLTGWSTETLLRSLAFIPTENPNGYGVYPTLYVGWTLIYEMFFYLIFSGVLILNLRKPALCCAGIITGISLLTLSSNFLGHGSLLLIEFAIGILIKEYLSAPKITMNLAARFIPALLLLLPAVWLLYTGTNAYARLFIAGFSVYAFVLMEGLFSKDWKILYFLKIQGDHSYSTYLSHVIVIGWFYHFLGSAIGTPWEWLAIAGIVLTIMLISRYSYWHIETSQPLTRLKHRVINTMTKAPTQDFASR